MRIYDISRNVNIFKCNTKKVSQTNRFNGCIQIGIRKNLCILNVGSCMYGVCGVCATAKRIYVMICAMCAHHSVMKNKETNMTKSSNDDNTSVND